MQATGSSQAACSRLNDVLRGVVPLGIRCVRRGAAWRGVCAGQRASDGAARGPVGWQPAEGSHGTKRYEQRHGLDVMRGPALAGISIASVGSWRAGRLGPGGGLVTSAGERRGTRSPSRKAASPGRPSVGSPPSVPGRLSCESSPEHAARHANLRSRRRRRQRMCSGALLLCIIISKPAAHLSQLSCPPALRPSLSALPTRRPVLAAGWNPSCLVDIVLRYLPIPANLQSPQ